MRRLDDEAVRVRRPRDEVLYLGVFQHAVTGLATMVGVDRGSSRGKGQRTSIACG